MTKPAPNAALPILAACLLTTDEVVVDNVPRIQDVRTMIALLEGLGVTVDLSLWDVSAEISRRLTRIFLRDAEGKRPVHGQQHKFQTDPHWRDLILFYEYFHGDSGAGVGASHQTGWTGLVAKLLQQSGE